jgi:hypothetical protein
VRKPRFSPGNARWIALSVGVFLLSVAIALVVATMGLFGFASGEAATGQRVEARVVTAWPCGRAEGMEVVRYSLDGREWEAQFDGCGHEADETVEVTVAAGHTDPLAHAADAAGGQGRFGRRLGGLLLTFSGLAGGLYAVLVRRGPRGTPLPALGPFDLPELRRSTARLTARVRRSRPRVPHSSN